MKQQVLDALNALWVESNLPINPNTVNDARVCEVQMQDFESAEDGEFSYESEGLALKCEPFVRATQSPSYDPFIKADGKQRFKGPRRFSKAALTKLLVADALDVVPARTTVVIKNTKLLDSDERVRTLVTLYDNNKQETFDRTLSDEDCKKDCAWTLEDILREASDFEHVILSPSQAKAFIAYRDAKRPDADEFEYYRQYGEWPDFADLRDL